MGDAIALHLQQFIWANPDHNFFASQKRVGVPTACLTCFDFSARAHRPLLSSFSSSGLGVSQQDSLSLIALPV
jgi:hypothetical protein